MSPVPTRSYKLARLPEDQPAARREPVALRREWAVIFTRPADWRAGEPVRLCVDEGHATTIRDTVPAKFLPAFTAVREDGEWVQVGEVRTS